VQELHLTDAGREALRTADAVVADVERQATEALGPDKTTQLRALLDQLAAALRKS